MAAPDVIGMMENAAGGEHIPFFIELEHPQLPERFGFVLDDVDYLFEELLWHRARVELPLVSDSDKPAETNFRFPNVDRRKTALLAELRGPLIISFRLYSSSWFDRAKEPREVRAGLTPIAAYEAYDLELRNVRVTPDAVSGQLRGFDARSEPLPAGRAVEADFPGLFYR